MRNLTYMISIVITGCLFASCGQAIGNSKDSLDQIITVNYDSIDVNVKDIMSDVRLVKLETSDKAIVGEISKLKIFEDSIYVLDKRGGNGILVFKKENGAFVRKFSKIGKGPGEVSDPVDFDIEDNFLWILDLASQKYVIYTLQGKFIGEKKLENRLLNFEFVGQKSIISLREQNFKNETKSEGKVLITKADGLEQKEYHFKESSDGNLRLPMVFSKYKNSILYWEIFNDTVYRYDDRGFRGAYGIEFGEKKIPQKLLELPLMQRLSELNSSPDAYAGLIENFLEFDRYVVFNFKTNSNILTNLYDKGTKKSKTIHYFLFNDQNIKFDQIQYKVDELTMAAVIYPHKIRRVDPAKTSPKISPLDNPIVLIMKIK